MSSTPMAHHRSDEDAETERQIRWAIQTIEAVAMINGINDGVLVAAAACILAENCAGQPDPDASLKLTIKALRAQYGNAREFLDQGGVLN